MLGSEILDAAVGVIFVFLLVSLIASAIREGIEGWLKTRATHLEAGIRELLHDKSGKGLVTELFNHPLIYGLYSGDYAPLPKGKWLAFTRGRNLPTYIPSRNFALALMDLAARGPVSDPNTPPTSAPISLQALRTNIGLIANPRVQRALLAAIDTAEGDLQKAQANIEAWYDSAMDRVSGWYKRSTQWILFVIGLTIAIVMNVNAIAVGNYLLRNRAARETLVAQAQKASSDPNFLTSNSSDIKNELQSFTLPIGWDYDMVWDKSSASQPSPVDKSQPSLTNAATTIKPSVAFKKEPFPFIFGWLLTALAATLGAPFWFDLLNRIMVIRSTVKPHQKSPEEASEDLQAPAGAVASQPPASPAPLPSPAATGPPPGANPIDQMDGCDVRIMSVTRDEELPAAQGG